MPDRPVPPKPNTTGGRKIAGVGVTWWIVGGVASVGIIYYVYHRNNTPTATVDPSTLDPTSAADYGGSSGIPYNVGSADPSGGSGFGGIPPGDSVTITEPDGTTTVVSPTAPGGSATPVDGTTATTGSATATATPVSVVNLPKPAVPATNATWMFHAESVLAHHGYAKHAVNVALAKYLTSRALYPHEVAIVEAATRWIGPPPNPPRIHEIPEPKRPRKTTTRKR